MSYTSTFPTNLVKFGYVAGAKFSRDSAKSSEAVVHREIGVIDVAKGIEALVKPTSDTGLGLDRVEYLETPTKDRGTGAEIASLLSLMTRSDVAKPIDVSYMHRVLIEFARAIENKVLYKATTVPYTDLTRAKDVFPTLVYEILNMIGTLRRVNYGDVVLPSDINSIIDILERIDKFNQFVAYWFNKHGFTLPQEAYNLVYVISAKVRRLTRVKIGEILTEEPHNAIVDVLAEEYELLKLFLEYLPRIPSKSDTAKASEVATVLKYVGLVTDYVSWWLYERYRYSFLYKDRGDIANGNILYVVDVSHFAGNPVVFEKHREIAVSWGGVRTLGIEGKESWGYVFMYWLRVYDGPTGKLKYEVVLESSDYLALVIGGDIQWCIYSPYRRYHAVSTFRGSNFIYYVDNYEQVLRALDVATGEEVWRTSIYGCYSYTNNVAVDDVDNDGVPEVVLFTYKVYASYPNKLMIINALDGSVEANWQHSNYQTYWAGFGLGDVDGDGKAEYFVGDWNGNLTAIDDDGSVMWYKTGVVPQRGDGQFGLALGDVDGDGIVEVLFTSWDEGDLACVSTLDGTREWYHDTGGGYADVAFPPFLLDADGDGKLEAYLWRRNYSNASGAGVRLVDDDGSLIWLIYLPYDAWWPHTVGDVDGDGYAEAVVIINYKLYVIKG